MTIDKNQWIAKVNQVIHDELKKSDTPALASAIFVAQFDEDTDEFLLSMSILKAWIKDEFGRKQSNSFENYVSSKMHKLQRVHKKEEITTQDKKTEDTKQPIEIITPIVEKVADDERFLYENIVVEDNTKPTPPTPQKIQPKARNSKPQPRKK
jgi:hypothetical protein